MSFFCVDSKAARIPAACSGNASASSSCTAMRISAMSFPRSFLPKIVSASRIRSPAVSSTLARRSSSYDICREKTAFSGFTRPTSSVCRSTRLRIPTFAISRPSTITSSVGAHCPSSTTNDQASSVAPPSTIMMSISPDSFWLPATTRSKTLFSMSSCVGFVTHSPSRNTMRTAPIGPSKGISDTQRAADAAFSATTSYWFNWSAERMVRTTCTSLRNPRGKEGRKGRSASRQSRIACSDARPSRRKKDPGIFPIAYIFSSTSTVSGKKLCPSRKLAFAVAVARTTVSPRVTVTAPPACTANRPVSKSHSAPAAWPCDLIVPFIFLFFGRKRHGKANQFMNLCSTTQLAFFAEANPRRKGSAPRDACTKRGTTWSLFVILSGEARVCHERLDIARYPAHAGN